MKDISLKLMFKNLKNYMKIRKVEKLLTNLHGKEKYVIHIRNLKQALNHGLAFKKYIESLNSIKNRG